jgi:para-nitrobenzyl esterase
VSRDQKTADALEGAFRAPAAVCQRAAADPQNDRYRLAEQVVAAWSSFARSGDPSTRTLRWPAYDLNSRPTMIFDRQSRIVDGVRSSVREAVLSN